jgi:protein AFG1
LIESHFHVRDLDSEIDYRKLPRALSKVYYDPITPENRLEFHKVFEGFTAGRPIVQNEVLEVWGRQLLVPKSTGVAPQDGQAQKGDSVAMFTFQELCGHPLSAADYLEIVKNFDTVFITDLPRLSLSEKDKVTWPFHSISFSQNKC